MPRRWSGRGRARAPAGAGAKKRRGWGCGAGGGGGAPATRGPRAGAGARWSRGPRRAGPGKAAALGPDSGERRRRGALVGLGVRLLAKDPMPHGDLMEEGARGQAECSWKRGLGGGVQEGGGGLCP